MATGKPVFTAYNNHTIDSKYPPFFTNRDHENHYWGEWHYWGYFENQHGEQFIFVFDRKKQQGRLWGGDCGWKTEMAVEELTTDDPESSRFVHVPGVNLSSDELRWLRACWDAATCKSS